MINQVYRELATLLELVPYDLSDIENQIWIDKYKNQFILCKYGFYPFIAHIDLLKKVKKKKKSKLW